jgi:hypothetical protein
MDEASAAQRKALQAGGPATIQAALQRLRSRAAGGSSRATAARSPTSRLPTPSSWSRASAPPSAPPPAWSQAGVVMAPPDRHRSPAMPRPFCPRAARCRNVRCRPRGRTLSRRTGAGMFRPRLPRGRRRQPACHWAVVFLPFHKPPSRAVDRSRFEAMKLEDLQPNAAVRGLLTECGCEHSSFCLVLETRQHPGFRIP